MWKLLFVMEKLKENFIVEDMREDPFSKGNLKDRSLVVIFFFSEFIRMLFLKKFGGLTEC